MSRALVLSAPNSGSGKTILATGLMRALGSRGISVQGAKSGPDYIDGGFHEAATGKPSMNLDAFAMSTNRIKSLICDSGLTVIEGAMGLFDGAPPDGAGSTADLAARLGLPVILVINASRMAQSVAPLASGFASHSPKTRVAGVILGQTGSERHEEILKSSLRASGIPVFGCVRRSKSLALPSRHLGLVQSRECAGLEALIEAAAKAVLESIDMEALLQAAMPVAGAGCSASQPAPPPAQRIAVAEDEAFGFLYPHMLRDWRRAGAELSFFSPLDDQCPDSRAELIYLPGGYPELHAGRLSQAERFRRSMRKMAGSALIYGECGGYMALGKGLVDAQGKRHEMLGLLELETSFAKRRLHLGYRRLDPVAGPWTRPCVGHEFHYATTVSARGSPMFKAADAEGKPLPDQGLVSGRVSGSFAHIIEFGANSA